MITLKTVHAGESDTAIEPHRKVYWNPLLHHYTNIGYFMDTAYPMVTLFEDNGHPIYSPTESLLQINMWEMIKFDPNDEKELQDKLKWV